ncbi:UNVERIFIED_CONTAM: hypothetical protein Slati_2859600 [Sesamum latifolium]|uniref:Uncharacterized protein n=1 Tax=Sesamum latifolium TaxID=2727402 RepID=A0AAW2VCC9_9LAMI
MAGTSSFFLPTGGIFRFILVLGDNVRSFHRGISGSVGKNFRRGSFGHKKGSLLDVCPLSLRTSPSIESIAAAGGTPYFRLYLS